VIKKLICNAKEVVARARLYDIIYLNILVIYKVYFNHKVFFCQNENMSSFWNWDLYM